MSLRAFWDEQAEPWSRFARTPGHDAYHEQFNFPAFLELVLPPGKATLDVGCGEGRVGAELRRRGHSVVGVDSSPRMVELAAEHHEAHVADAAALPFEDASFDLVIAYMSIMNFDEPEAAVRESARVLERGGRVCAAVVHPLDGAGTWSAPEPDAQFAVEGSYYEQEPKLWVSERDGIRVTFQDRSLALEQLVRCFEDAGLLVEALREPQPSDEFVQRFPISARRRRVPLFLHLRALKP
jgi:SAM-dependent methyltransferase